MLLKLFFPGKTERFLQTVGRFVIKLVYLTQIRHLNDSFRIIISFFGLFLFFFHLPAPSVIRVHLQNVVSVV